VRELIHLVASWMAAFLVAALPERLKTREPAREFSTVPAHVASAFAEVLIAVVAFIAGLVAYVEGFSREAGFVYLTNRPTLSPGEFFGIGVIGYLSYLLHPGALLALYCFAEGILRALEAVVTGRMLGMAVVALPIRAALRGQWLARRLRLRRALGPLRDDEVVPADRTPDGNVWVYTSREKDWSDVQVVEHGGGFFTLAGRDLVERGEHCALLYRFRPLDEAAVIRGPVVRLVERRHEAAHPAP